MGRVITLIASYLGYILNFLYNFFNNYGVAIIVFTVILKVVLLPFSIKQQKTMKKSAKIQEKLKVLQEKYKNDQMKLNQETMELYKQENMSPFSGCLTSIAQLFVVLAMFYLVSSPLTYMKKIDSNIINDYKTKLTQEAEKHASDGDNESGRSNSAIRYPEIAIIKQYGSQDPKVYLNMEFLGLDLSDVPSQNYTNWKVYIIPVLYVMMSLVSTRLMTNLNKVNKKEESKVESNNEEIKPDDETKDLVKKEEEDKEADMMEEMNKNMTVMMPVMSVMIAMIAPLGLALYWLISNFFSIIERLVLNKLFKDEGEKQNG